MWAIIGGSGFEKFEDFKVIEELDRETPFGKTSKGFKRVSIEGVEALFIPRHGIHHNKTPSEVNYRANIYALKAYGATKLLAFSAVGSLVNECAPGDLVIPSQFIDRTKGHRKATYCGDGLVGHASLAEPVTKALVDGAKSFAESLDFKVHFQKTLVVMEGPQFSTKAESHLYRSWQAHIIGMTSYPEYALAREAGLAYMNCCFVTDYDCWKDDIPHVTVEEVMRIMKLNNKKAFVVAQKLLHSTMSTVQDAQENANGLKSALMTPLEEVSDKQKEWLEVLMQ